jgi:uncharacterized protein
MKPEEVYLDAVKNGDLNKVRLMLEDEPGLASSRTDSGLSAVLLAVYYQKPQVLKLLLSHRPDLTIFEAAAAGQEQSVRRLLDEDPTLAQAFSPDGFQPLGLAAFFGHAGIARLLLQRGAAVSTPSNNAQHVPPLNSAAAGRHLDIARLLLEHEADPNSRQAGGFTPLHSAAQNGDEPLARLLLEHGADPALENDRGQTPAAMAAAMGHTPLADLLGA